LIVSCVPHLLQLNDCEISTTSSVSSSGGMLANEDIELRKNLNTTSPIKSAIK